MGMIKMKRYWLEKGIAILLFGITTVSCIPDPLAVEGIPVVKPQIVVSSQIIPDQSLVILLTKSFGALDANGDSDPETLLNQIAIGDAEVTLVGPDETYELTPLTLGFYGGIIIPFEAGQEYTLYVDSPTLGEVHATTVVKPQVPFDAIEAKLFFNGVSDTLAQITHRFIDPVNKNWYMLNVQEVEQEDIIQNVINPRAFTRLLEDTEFENTGYEETFRVFPREYDPGDTIAVSISNISEEYYRFMEMRQDNRFSFVEFLGEPVNYPTNVVGGKGFFNLYIPDIRTFVLE
jgi:hypothetical protein